MRSALQKILWDVLFQYGGNDVSMDQSYHYCRKDVFMKHKIFAASIVDRMLPAIGDTSTMWKERMFRSGKYGNPVDEYSIMKPISNKSLCCIHGDLLEIG